MNIFKWLGKMLWHPSSLGASPTTQCAVPLNPNPPPIPEVQKRKARRDSYHTEYAQNKRKEIVGTTEDGRFYIDCRGGWKARHEYDEYFKEFYEDVSQPVFAFLDALEASPHRFRFKKEYNSKTEHTFGETIYWYKDNLIHKDYVKIYTDRDNYPYSRDTYERDFQFLTKDEIDYLTQEINKHINNRKEKVEKYKKNKSRQKYIDIYCKEAS